ncbi:DNA polymerase Y family protein [Albimonas sp. CAU 1670]|uniref:Y-family DNA polymerase n=1 Tax=Albimonas sp. CAU 1670 TaxID=3032599 RepID=UPI0023DB414B|nr:DNA polymerase Y family protein [Albimonas sp. CAU 1670]MDF2234032.1 DNA polymerase Y family protein [Albimonas sp. CAU 1670]
MPAASTRPPGGAAGAAQADVSRAGGARDASRGVHAQRAAARAADVPAAAGGAAREAPQRLSGGRRILCLWLPRLAAERELRRAGAAHLGLGEVEEAFAVAEDGPAGLRLISCNAAAEAAGLGPGMGLADARAIHPALATRMRDRLGEARFREGLLRWAGRFSPWVAPEAPPDTPELAGEGGLALDVTGCAHLFGGEAAMAARMIEELAALGLSAQAGVADSRGAAWALARCGLATAAPGQDDPADAPLPGRDGDAIRQDAHATRVRSPSRSGPAGGAPRGSWARPRGAGRRPRGAEGALQAVQQGAAAIAPPGGSREALAGLPVAALRLPPSVAAALARLGLRRIGDLYGIPRSTLARRFGIELPTRLDQALAQAPEPVSPVRPPRPHAVRLTLPEPIGLRADLEAALARLLLRLAERLEEEGLGARRLRLAIRRVDGGEQAREVGLARPGRDPDRLARLFEQALDAFDAGFGIDAVRLEATVVEPLHMVQRRGHFEARAEAEARRKPGGGDEFADLLGRLGSRIGLDRLLRFEAADTHIPEKTARLVPAAYAPASRTPWPAPPGPRPALMLRPEPLRILEPGRPPPAFRWRRLERRLSFVEGPERIAPEWWLDDPDWRTGPRDYWRVETERGDRLWLFQALGRAAVAPGEQPAWFVQGIFA